MAVSITTLAALIASGQWDYDGGSFAAFGSNVNSGAFRYSGNSYVVLVDNATFNRLQVYRSADDITWSTYGSPLITTYAPDGQGNWGPCSLLVGNQLYAAFTPTVNDGTKPDLIVAAFDLDAGSWGSPLTWAAPTNHGPVTPLYMARRPDGSIVILVEGGSLNTDFATWIVALVLSSGSFTPYALADGPGAGYGPHVSAAAMDASGNVRLFWLDHYGSIFYEQSFSFGNVAGAFSALSFSGSVGGLFGQSGLGFGCYGGATFYAPFWDTSDNLVLAYNSGSGWTTTGTLFTFSVFGGITPALFIVGSTMICVAANVAGGLKIAVGYVPVASAATPGAWTWSTVYDGASPSPAVSGATAPYLITGSGSYGLVVNSIAGGDIRVTMTARNSSPGTGVFTALICRIAVTGGVTLIFNEFE